jgi:hypothetical protein
MSTWDNQAKDLQKRKLDWSNSQAFGFTTALADSENEEEVKATYVKHFSLPFKTGKRQDLTVKNILFEFKYSVDFKNISIASKVIAQGLYYIRRLHESQHLDQITHLIIADKDEAAIINIQDFEHFFTSCSYGWKEYRPSSPDPKLIDHIKNSKLIETYRIYDMRNEDDISVFETLLHRYLKYEKSSANSPQQSNPRQLPRIPFISKLFKKPNS